MEYATGFADGGRIIISWINEADYALCLWKFDVGETAMAKKKYTEVKMIFEGFAQQTGDSDVIDPVYPVDIQPDKRGQT